MFLVYSMEVLMMVLLQYVEFSNWLCSQPQEEVAGVTGDGSNCPLANWLKQSRGGLRWQVGNEQAYIINDGGSLETVYWLDRILVEFVMSIDGLGQTGNGYDVPVVSYRQCVHALSLVIAKELGIEGYA